MKQTSSALTFLLAQYRAIFKHAYIKGLAPAVLLTAGLAAAGSAQAATSLTDIITELASGDYTLIIGTSGESTPTNTNYYDKINISGGSNLTWNANVIVQSGGADANTIKGSGSALSITGTGSLTIDAVAADSGATISASSSGMTLAIGSIDVTNGTLKITAETDEKTTTVSADTIMIGADAASDEGAGAAARDSELHTGILSLSATGSGGTATLGAADSAITVKNTGKIDVTAGSGTAAISGTSLTLEEGALFLVHSSGTASNATVNVTDLNIKQGAGHVISGDTTNIMTEKFSGDKATIAGNLLLTEGAKLELKAHTDASKGVITLAEGSHTVLGDKLTVAQGTLVVDDKAALNASSTSGSITVSGASSTLQINSETLKSYLAGSGSHDKIDAATGQISGTEDNAQGQVSLSGSTLYLTDTAQVQVDLSDEAFKFSGSAAAGYIHIDSSATIKGDNLAVSNKLTSGSGITIKANTLTLGNGGTASTDGYGFSGATVKNLIANTTNEIKLGEAITLDVTLGDSTADIADANGKITGDFTLSNSGKGLTATHGNFTYDEGTLTISGGTLEVKNETLTGGNIDTTLTISDTLHLYSNGSIKVDGSTLTDAATVLDISQVAESDFEFTDGSSSNLSVDVQKGGTFKVAGYQLEEMLDVDSVLSSGAKVTLSGGTIHVVDDLTLEGSKLRSGAATAETLAFSGGANLLQVDGQLTLEKVGTLQLAATDEVQANELTLNTESTAAVLSGGQFTAWSALDGNHGITVSGTSASLLLGGFDQDGAAKSTGGTIKTDLTLQNGAITVQNGAWKGTSQTLTVEGGTFKVGDSSASSNTFDTSLALSKLDLQGGTTTVDTVGTLTTKSLYTTTGAQLQVSGSMTVDGVYTAQSGGTPASYGISLTSGTITVGDNATLSFGADAVKAITVNADETSADKWISIADNTFGAGDNSTAQVITTGVGSTVSFAFGEDTTFSAGALTEFRKEIFGVESGTLDGFINLGDAKIDGLVVDNGEVAWSKLKDYTDLNSDYTTNLLKEAKVTGITTDAELRGNLGSLSSTELKAGEQITVTGNLALNNAAGNSGSFASTSTGELLGIDVTENADVALNNGGSIGTVTFSNKGGSLVVDSSATATNIAAVDAEYADVKFNQGTATVAGTTEAKVLTTAAGTNTTFTEAVTVGKRDSAGSTSSLAGTTNFKAAATFEQGVTVEDDAQAYFASNVTFNGAAALNGDTTVEGTTTAKNGLTIDQGAAVTLNTLVTSGNVFVGSVTTEDGHEGATASLEVETLDLNGKHLVVDPDWHNAAGLAFAGVGKFTDGVTADDGDAGVLDGSVYALQNSIVSLGNSNKAKVLDIFAQYIDDQGNLSDDKDGVGAIVYVADTINVTQGNSIVVDKTQNKGTYDSATYYSSHGVYIGDNSVLGVEVSAANGAEAAITFAGSDITVAASDSGKIVLTGDYDQSDFIKLFADDNGTVTVENPNGIRVETINGLLAFDYKGADFSINKMEVQYDNIASAFAATSSPVHHSLVAYGTGNSAWQDKEAVKEVTKTHGAAAHNVVYSNDAGGYVYADKDGNPTSQLVKDQDQFTIVKVENPAYDPDDTSAGAAPQYLDKVYYKASNALLSAINNQQANSGISAESAARMADFAGVAQVALKAGAATSEAISGRMGIGATNTALTFAQNGQGAGIWLAPIYLSSDSDGFEAQGINYGTDISLYGVALGGDYTLASGITVGAMFNVGSGDADGQGAGSNVSSDFDYYGFGLYAGYSVGAFSLVGDLAYTAVDNDVEASTEFADIGTMKSSLDSSNLSLGISGAYEFATNVGVKVTPHVGLRYSYIDIDDYTVDSKAGAIGSYSADSLSVFSIPVGVTIAGEFNAGSWSVKPSFDVTLTGNFGDDENEGTFKWAGVENIDCALTSEIFDNFTYGATLGVAAEHASGLSFGLNVGYTGSSNVDDLGVSANARFTF